MPEPTLDLKHKYGEITLLAYALGVDIKHGEKKYEEAVEEMVRGLREAIKELDDGFKEGTFKMLSKASILVLSLASMTDAIDAENAQQFLMNELDSPTHFPSTMNTGDTMDLPEKNTSIEIAVRTAFYSALRHNYLREEQIEYNSGLLYALLENLIHDVSANTKNIQLATTVRLEVKLSDVAYASEGLKLAGISDEAKAAPDIERLKNYMVKSENAYVDVFHKITVDSNEDTIDCVLNKSFINYLIQLKSHSESVLDLTVPQKVGPSTLPLAQEFSVFRSELRHKVFKKAEISKLSKTLHSIIVTAITRNGGFDEVHIKVPIDHAVDVLYINNSARRNYDESERELVEQLLHYQVDYAREPTGVRRLHPLFNKISIEEKHGILLLGLNPSMRIYFESIPEQSGKNGSRMVG